MADPKQFDEHKFVSLETFRRGGVGVKTPVWFVREGQTFYVWTMGDSGKVKRIRNNPRVNLAPCTRFGQVTGEWVAARASVDESAVAVRYVEARLSRKVGFMFAVFRVVDRLRDWRKKSRRVSVTVSVD